MDLQKRSSPVWGVGEGHTHPNTSPTPSAQQLCPFALTGDPPQNGGTEFAGGVRLQMPPGRVCLLLLPLIWSSERLLRPFWAGEALKGWRFEHAIGGAGNSSSRRPTSSVISIPHVCCFLGPVASGRPLLFKDFKQRFRFTLGAEFHSLTCILIKFLHNLSSLTWTGVL